MATARTHARITFGAALSAALIGGLCVGSPVLANQGAPDTQASEPLDLAHLHAEYKFVGGNKQRAQLQAAIDAGIKGLPNGLYQLAHRRISNTQKAWPTIRLDIDGKDIRVKRGPEKAQHTTASKQKHVMTNRYGERYVYRQRTSAHVLSQTVTGLGNKTKITYRFNEDGSKLTFKMTIDADLLPRPITYVLSYARVGG